MDYTYWSRDDKIDVEFSCDFYEARIIIHSNRIDVLSLRKRSCSTIIRHDVDPGVRINTCFGKNEIQRSMQD